MTSQPGGSAMSAAIAPTAIRPSSSPNHSRRPIDMLRTSRTRAVPAARGVIGSTCPLKTRDRAVACMDQASSTDGPRYSTRGRVPNSGWSIFGLRSRTSVAISLSGSFASPKRRAPTGQTSTQAGFAPRLMRW